MSYDQTGICVSWLSDRICEALGVVGTMLNSSFTTALLGSLAGALAGAVAAQRIVERNKRREELVLEVRNTNAAIMTGFSLTNSVLGLKHQQIQGLYDNYKQQQAKLSEYKERNAKTGEAIEAFSYEGDLGKIQVPSLPIDTLRELVFNRISVHGRPLSLVSHLESAISGLSAAVSERHRIVDEFRTFTIPEQDQPYHYFGLELPSGHTHQEYPDLFEAINRHVNDIAFFGSLLCDDLIKHGKRLKVKEKKGSEEIPDVTEVNFKEAKENGLMPSETEYADWLKAFHEHRWFKG